MHRTRENRTKFENGHGQRSQCAKTLIPNQDTAEAYDSQDLKNLRAAQTPLPRVGTRVSQQVRSSAELPRSFELVIRICHFDPRHALVNNRQRV
jgi:hypothetical protein